MPSLAHEGNPKEDKITIGAGDVLSTATLDIGFLFFGPGDIPNVACGESQAVNPRRSGEQRVDDRHVSNRAEAAPFFGHSEIEGQQPLRIVHDETSQPVLQRGGVARVASTNGFDASPDFADDQHADVEILVGDAREPRADVLVSSGPLAQL